MANSELSQAWQAHQERAEINRRHMEAEAAREAALQAEFDAEEAALLRHAQQVGKTALALTEITGWSEEPTNPRGPWRDRRSRVSDLISLGKLSEDRDDYGFARINVQSPRKWQHVIKERRLLPDKVITTEVTTDEIARVSATFYGGNEDGSNLTSFASSVWEKDLDYGEKELGQVERHLGYLADVLGYQEENK